MNDRSKAILLMLLIVAVELTFYIYSTWYYLGYSVWKIKTIKYGIIITVTFIGGVLFAHSIDRNSDKLTK